MTRIIRWHMLAILLPTLLLPINPLLAAETQQVTAALLKQAQQRLQHSPDNAATLYQSSDWLLGLPSISLSHLQGLDNQRSFEQELSLNLPLKSPAMHRLDNALRPINDQLTALQHKLQQLYLSGLLRQYWWQQRTATAELNLLTHKQQLLQQLLEHQQALSRSGEAPVSQRLMLQRELLQQQLAQLPVKQQLASANAALKQLTGLQQLPDLDETARPLPTLASGVAHPLWQIATLQLTRQKLLGQAQADGVQTPWTLSINGKNTATPGMEEQAIGVAINIPLPFSSGLSQQDVGTLVEQQLHLAQQQQQLMLQTHLALAELRQQRQQLQAQQQLLKQSLSLSQQLTNALAATKQQGFAQYQAWLRSYIDTLDSESRMQLNQLALAALHAKQLQALGVTL